MSRKTCSYCDQKINLKKEQYIMKYSRFWGYYGSKGFVHKKRYWHPWCWELEKKISFFSERSYSDKDPALIKQEKIDSAKKEWLKNAKQKG